MTNAPNDDILESLAEEFTASLRAGQTPSVESYTSRYPELADDIQDMLSSIAMMEKLSRCEVDYREQANAFNRPARKIEQLGDFRIVREIGRGGMGVVYEAVDCTLQRRVALKVLNDSALATPKHINRFRRESRLAAQLHHTNIVSVFGVGESNDQHFYAMQYIEGVSVQEMLDGLRGQASTAHFAGSATSIGILEAFRAGEFADSATEPQFSTSSVSSSVSSNSASDSASDSASSTNDSNTASISEVSGEVSGEVVFDSSFDKTLDLTDTDLSKSDQVTNSSSAAPRVQVFSRTEVTSTETFGSAYWRSVARLGVQVADALQYAHTNGILHRDIKPANLLYDAGGTVWVADFGLAKLNEADDLTKTGDVVGTLKYMAPEQLDGNADTRTDTYALGLTLYELLTLRAVCTGETYKELFVQKQNNNHTAPRKLVPGIPRDLETIVLKSIEWEPEKRYASARELSDDLKRFLEDRPIQARRVPVTELLWRWCRRNRTIAALGATAAMLLLLLPIVLGAAYVREKSQTKRMETTLGIVMDGFNGLFGSYLENDAPADAIADSSGDSSQLAPAMLTKDTASVLEKMLTVYDRLAETNDVSTSLSLAVESATARRKVGDLYQRLGQFTEATSSYEEAAKRFQTLSERRPEHFVDVARTYQAIGRIHEQRQDFKAAGREYGLALASLKAAPLTPNSQYEIARTHYLLGKQPVIEGGRKGRMGPGRRIDDDATRMESGLDRREHLDAAIGLLTALRLKNQENVEYRFLLARCLREQEQTRASQARPGARPGARSGQARSGKDREQHVRREGYIELLSSLVDEFPNVPRYRFELCETYRRLGSGNPLVDPDERIHHLLLAKELAEQLVVEQRNVAPYRINLAHIYAFLGANYGHGGDYCQGEKFTQLSRETHQSVIRDFPGLAALSNRLTTDDTLRLGEWFLQLQRYEELIELLQPLGDNLFQQTNASADESGDESSKESLASDLGIAKSKLRECCQLLLPAYDAIEDEVGYLIALTWLEVCNGAGPGAPPPRFRDAVRMAKSYDVDQDGHITRSEVPPRMSLEWFARLDVDQNNEVDHEELEALRSHRP